MNNDNAIINKLVEDNFNFRYFVNSTVESVMANLYCKVEFCNSCVRLEFDDFTLNLSDYFSVQFKGSQTHYRYSDFQKINKLVDEIKKYNPTPNE